MEPIVQPHQRFTLALVIFFVILGVLGIVAGFVTLLMPPEEANQVWAESSGGSVLLGIILAGIAVWMLWSYVMASREKRRYIIAGILLLWAGAVDRLLPAIIDIHEHTLRMFVLPIFGVGMLMMAANFWRDYNARVPNEIINPG